MTQGNNEKRYDENIQGCALFLNKSPEIKLFGTCNLLQQFIFGLWIHSIFM
jgi:hypothetical protein